MGNSTGPRVLGLMRPKLIILGIRKGTIFGRHWTLHITTYTPSALWIMEVAASQCGSSNGVQTTRWTFWSSWVRVQIQFRICGWTLKGLFTHDWFPWVKLHRSDVQSWFRSVKNVYVKKQKKGKTSKGGGFFLQALELLFVFEWVTFLTKCVPLNSDKCPHACTLNAHMCCQRKCVTLVSTWLWSKWALGKILNLGWGKKSLFPFICMTCKTSVYTVVHWFIIILLFRWLDTLLIVQMTEFSQGETPGMIPV